MAADVCGAELAGGRQLYLTILAQMALRNDAPPVSWAARPFLPTPGTLMRRIEMLHRQRRLPSRSVSMSRRAVIGVLLTLAACLIAGLRGPGESQVASAAPPEAAATAKTGGKPMNLDFVPNDALAVLALRPAELTKLRSLQGVRKAMELAKIAEPLGMPIDELEEFKLVASGNVEGRTPETQPWQLMMFRSIKPRDWSKFAASVIGPSESAIVNGQGFFRAKEARPGAFAEFWLPDDRTIVITSKDRAGGTFSLRGPVNQPAWADKWQQVAGAPATAYVSAVAMQPIVGHIFRDSPGERPDVTDHADFALFKGEEVSGAFQVTGTVPCRSTQSAQAIDSLVHKGLDAIRAEIQEVSQRQPMDIIFQIVLRLIDATKVDASGTTVRSRTVVDADLGMEFAKAVGPARLAAHRAQSMNKLKQIAIALLNYHNTHKSFPPAVVMGPDGKTPHSWRLELLPYMDVGKKNVYDRYKMDEPWDSPDNLKLIDEAADLFSVPGEQPSKDCGYFLLVGPGTVFDPDQPPAKIRNITDGTSKTIGVVEAKRKIPWTKPEDIAFDPDPDKPLPTLGGFFDGGFNTAFMDGSVRFLAEDLDEATLRALISRAGREPVPVPE